MCYKCVNCGKMVMNFTCSCNKDQALWDSSLRKNQNKEKRRLK